MPYYISPRTWSDCVFTDLLAIDNITKMEDLEHKCSCRGGAPEDGLSPALSASAPGGWLHGSLTISAKAGVMDSTVVALKFSSNKIRYLVY